MQELSGEHPFDVLQSQEAEKTEASERNARQRRIEQEDLRWLMSDKRGRRIMHRLLSAAGIYRSSFTGDATLAVFREGERNIGLRFLHDVQETCPERYVTMLQEQQPNDDGNARNRTGRKRE